MVESGRAPERLPERGALPLVGVIALAAFLAACGSGDPGSDARSSAPGASATEAPASTTSTPSSRSIPCPGGARPVTDLAYEDLPGVDPALLSLDVYPPAHGCPAPVVIWVHGGGWRIGDKRNQMADKVRLLNDAGYAVVSVDYRLTDPASPEPVRYPTHNEDVAAAVAWVHDHIAGYGGDPTRLALLGHSAGAQIVASVATDERYLGEHGLGLDALRCAAPLDTEGYDVAGPAGAGIDIYRDVFGDDPANVGRRLAAVARRAREGHPAVPPRRARNPHASARGPRPSPGVCATRGSRSPWSTPGG